MMGILSGHVPTLEALKPGVLEVIESGNNSKKWFSEFLLFSTQFAWVGLWKKGSERGGKEGRLDCDAWLEMPCWIALAPWPPCMPALVNCPDQRVLCVPQSLPDSLPSTPTTPSPSTLSRPVRPFRRVSLIYLSPLTLFICRADSLDSFSPEVCLPRSLLPCFDCVDETSPLRRPSVRVSLRLSALLVVRELRRRRLRRRSKFRSSRVSRRRSRLKPVVGWGPSGGIELRRTTRKG
jgi:hypothetical protein